MFYKNWIKITSNAACVAYLAKLLADIWRGHIFDVLIIAVGLEGGIPDTLLP